MGENRIDALGVPGSVPRRVLSLLYSLGFTLIGGRDFEHPSKTSFVVKCETSGVYTTVTLEDTEHLPTCVSLGGPCQEHWTSECTGPACDDCGFCPVHAYEANRQGEGRCIHCVEEVPRG